MDTHVKLAARNFELIGNREIAQFEYLFLMNE